MMSNDEKKKINVQEIKKYWLEEALKKNAQKSLLKMNLRK
jgi:hypothetical protein